jgi:hypothetical protein
MKEGMDYKHDLNPIAIGCCLCFKESPCVGTDDQVPIAIGIIVMKSTRGFLEI